jgi:hypothetical protein
MQVSAGVEAEDGASEEENVEDELHWERLGGEIIRLTLQPTITDSGSLLQVQTDGGIK